MAKLVDAPDSKSGGGDTVPVRFRLSVPNRDFKQSQATPKPVSSKDLRVFLLSYEKNQAKRNGVYKLLAYVLCVHHAHLTTKRYGRDYKSRPTARRTKSAKGLQDMTSLELFDNGSSFALPLRDGELVDFRPVRQADREIIQHGMSELSLKSRYFRFFTPIAKLSDAQLQYFTEVDQQNHIAWIALAHDEPGHPGLGIARFIRMRNQPTMAEFAVVVLDSHQHRGLGTVLMAVLYKMASIKGMETLRGFILPENTVMSHWLGRLGAVGDYENAVYRMDLAVCSNLSCLPDTPTGRRFRECVHSIPTL